MNFDKEYLRLYAVTDRSWTHLQPFEQQIEDAIKGGITLLQLREKKSTNDVFLTEAQLVHRLTSKYAIPLIINDNVEVMIKSDAEGIHIGQEDLAVSKVRQQIGKDKILGVTVRTIKQAREAQEMGADYLGVGAIFGSTTKLDAPVMSIEQLTKICQAVDIPVVAIGGIGISNIQLLTGSGVAGVAVVSAIFGQTKIIAATQALLAEARCL